MVEVGEIPLLIHIMRWYYSFGFSDFVICAGYRSWDIKKFFLTYEMRLNHMELDHRVNATKAPQTFGVNSSQERWRVRVIDTGPDSMTGARVARAFDSVYQVEPFEHFALTYGDGLTDANLGEELDFHATHGKLGTVLGVKNNARYGELDVSGDSQVEGFLEKPESRQGYINGGFFFFSAGFREYLSPRKESILEREPLARLASDAQLRIYRHHGFWASVDTLRDKIKLQTLWDSGQAPWAVNHPPQHRISADLSEGETPEMMNPPPSRGENSRGLHERN